MFVLFLCISNFSIIEGPETLQDFVQMQLKEIEDNIKHRRNRIFFLMEEVYSLFKYFKLKDKALFCVILDIDWTHVRFFSPSYVLVKEIEGAAKNKGFESYWWKRRGRGKWDAWNPIINSFSALCGEAWNRIFFIFWIWS